MGRREDREGVVGDLVGSRCGTRRRERASALGQLAHDSRRR